LGRTLNKKQPDDNQKRRGEKNKRAQPEGQEPYFKTGEEGNEGQSIQSDKAAQVEDYRDFIPVIKIGDDPDDRPDKNQENSFIDPLHVNDFFIIRRDMAEIIDYRTRREQVSNAPEHQHGGGNIQDN
jgi:hypothetical protein